MMPTVGVVPQTASGTIVPRARPQHPEVGSARPMVLPKVRVLDTAEHIPGVGQRTIIGTIAVERPTLQTTVWTITPGMLSDKSRMLLMPSIVQSFTPATSPTLPLTR